MHLPAPNSDEPTLQSDAWDEGTKGFIVSSASAGWSCPDPQDNGASDTAEEGRQTSVPSADFHAMKSRGIKGKIGANVRDSGIRVKRIKISRISHGRMGTERTKEKVKKQNKTL